MFSDPSQLMKMARYGHIIQAHLKGKLFLIEVEGSNGGVKNRVDLHMANVILMSSYGPYKAIWLKEAVYHPKWKKRLNMFYLRESWDSLRGKLDRSGLRQFTRLTKRCATTIPSLHYLEQSQFGSYSFSLSEEVKKALGESLSFYLREKKVQQIKFFPGSSIAVDGKFQNAEQFQRMVEFHRLMRSRDCEFANWSILDEIDGHE